MRTGSQELLQRLFGFAARSAWRIAFPTVGHAHPLGDPEGQKRKVARRAKAFERGNQRIDCKPRSGSLLQSPSLPFHFLLGGPFQLKVHSTATSWATSSSPWRRRPPTRNQPRSHSQPSSTKALAQVLPPIGSTLHLGRIPLYLQLSLHRQGRGEGAHPTPMRLRAGAAPSPSA